MTEPAARPPLTEDPSWVDLIWVQFGKRKVARGALIGLLGLLLLAIYAPLLASNKPLLWRVDDGPLSSPWLLSLFDRNFFENGVDVFFNALLVCVSLLGLPAAWAWRRAASLPRAARGARRTRLLLAAIGALLLTLGLNAAAPQARPKEVFPALQAQLEARGAAVLAVYPPLPHSFRDGVLDDARARPSAAHPLGTDAAGRDVLVRLIFGARISLTIGVFAVSLYITIGTVLGALAGYFGGRVDLLIQRLIEVVICIPSLFLILSVAAFIEDRSIFHIMVIIAAVAWTTPARLVRAEFLRHRNLDFVAAARAIGYPHHTIIFAEILPNTLGPVLVSATFGVASAILTESTMSFLGLGDITVPSWGQMLNAGRTTSEWTLILAPGFAIFVTVSLLNLVGDGFRDAIDPKLRR